MNSYGETSSTMSSKRPIPIVRDADAALSRGIEALERERIEEAIGLLRQAADLAPGSARAWLALGIAATRALEIGEATTALKNAIELEPRNFYAHFRMAQLYMRVGVPTLARTELDIAMDLSEDEGQRALARQLLAIDKQRETKRIWRPDFTKLKLRRLGGKKS